MRQLIGVLILTLAASGAVSGEESTPRKTSSKTTYYLDSRDFNTAALFASTSGLPLGLSVWGFVDLHSDQKNSSDRFDASRYFLEYRLRRALDPK